MKTLELSIVIYIKTSKRSAMHMVFCKTIESLLCLPEAANFKTGYQLCHLFIVILVHCAPVDPHHLWEASKHHLCNDLAHQLTHIFYIIKPNEEQIYDYRLYLIDQELRKHGKSLQDFPTMPRSQNDWGHLRGNQLIFEQRNYNREEQQEFIDRGIPTLNP